MGSVWMLKYIFNTQLSKTTSLLHFLPVQSHRVLSLPTGESVGLPWVFLEYTQCLPCVCLDFKVCKNMSELFKIFIDGLFLLYCSVLIPSIASDTYNIKTLAYKCV